MKPTHNQPQVTDDTAAGAAIYSRPLLSVYDLFVLGFSNSFVWQCPSRLILDFYNEHASGKHLNVGFGTDFIGSGATLPQSSDGPAL